MSAVDSYVPARLWSGNLGEGDAEIEDQGVGLSVERDEEGPGRVAIHTMIDGTGSHVSYYLDREAAIELAAKLLNTVALSS